MPLTPKIEIKNHSNYLGRLTSDFQILKDKHFMSKEALSDNGYLEKVSDEEMVFTDCSTSRK